MAQCGDPFSGGRRTRKRKAGPRRKHTAKKVSRARARSERLMKELASYKLKGGAMYSFNQGAPIGVGAASVGAVDNTQFYNSATGQPIAGGRRRKSRRRQRGGAEQVTVGKVYAGFDGSGARGIADAVQGVHPGNKF